MIHWIATVDRGRARLLKCHRAPRSRWHIDEIDTLEKPELDVHEHRRPSMLARPQHGRGYLAAPSDERDEERRRFAKEAAAWLTGALDTHRIDQLDLFAPARMLHELSQQWPKQRRTRINGHESVLTNFPPHELAQHPAIVTVLAKSAKLRRV